MQASLEVPTATSVRSVPAKLLIDNRVVINNHLARSRGGKVSFTHIIGFALVKDPLKVNFVDLRDWVLALEDFDDDPKHCGEKILEAIQQAWIDEVA